MSVDQAGETYEAVVFSGGGCHCFWQAGFWTEAALVPDPPLRVVSAVSAGAAFARRRLRRNAA